MGERSQEKIKIKTRSKKGRERRVRKKKKELGRRVLGRKGSKEVVRKEVS